jgi:hypothetical protein
MNSAFNYMENLFRAVSFKEERTAGAKRSSLPDEVQTQSVQAVDRNRGNRVKRRGQMQRDTSARNTLALGRKGSKGYMEHESD